MLVSHAHKFIFLKTHKTASTSIEGALEPLCTPLGHEPAHEQPLLESAHGIVGGRNGGQKDDDPIWAHSSAMDVRKHVGEETFDTYTKIYSVRNPYDKVVSWFWHVMPNDTRAELESDFEATRLLFQRWLRMRPSLPNDLPYYRIKGKKFDAFPIFYERIGQDLERLAETTGIPVDPGAVKRWKMNKRRHHGIELADYYDGPSAAVVQRHFAKEFQFFGYSRDLVTAA